LLRNVGAVKDIVMIYLAFAFASLGIAVLVRVYRRCVGRGGRVDPAPLDEGHFGPW